MKIKNKLNKNELDLLEKSNLIIEDKDYSNDEIMKLEEEIADIMLDHLDKKQDYTPLALEYEKIHDKFIEFEDE